MAQSSPSDTPQELIDEIIDYCSGDKETLIACSLTSRTWVHRTRKHLFSKLTLTDKTFPVWCGTVVTPAAGSRPQQQAVPNLHPSVSSSYTPHCLSSYVTSLHLVPTYSSTSPNNLGAHKLFQAKSHLSAFTNLKSLTFTAVSFLAFSHATLKACFGSLAETVHDLKLSMCLLDEDKFSPFLRLFTRLESLRVDGNTWHPSVYSLKMKTFEKNQITLRGSFTASKFSDKNQGMFDSLAAAKMEYHTITFGYNHHSTVPKLSVLLAKCKDHLETLSLTALEWNPGPLDGDFQPRLVLSLSLCKKLVEIQALFNHAHFERITPILKSVVSPRFRKLRLFLTPPMPTTEVGSWKRLDEEVTALAERVNATAVTDTLEVLFSSYPTTVGELVFSDFESALPRIASDARVSLRVENIPFALKQ